MASKCWSVLALVVLLFMTFFSSSSIALPTSFIAASPALLPNPPLSSPALSPDITPQFPSPAAPGLSPTQSSVPTIPSNPSPPNPDFMLAPGPGMAFSPSGSLPTSSSVALISFGSLLSVLVFGLLPFWLM